MIKSFVLLFLLLCFFGCQCQNMQEGNLESNKDNQNNEVSYPSYLNLHKTGELRERAEELWNRMQQCDLCPRNCGANRLEGKRGICKANATLEISSYVPHYGEESELVGSGGSGTIFFTNCPLLCVFCFNYEISQLGMGSQHTYHDLADIMLRLQRMGCSNINLVTPTHYLPHILYAIDLAAMRGLRLPIVYNTSGYEKVEILKYLDGVVDIYLPDFKYGCSENAGKYSIGASDYPDVAQDALLEMNRQVGVLIVDKKTNTAKRGLMIRHLVMPNNAACSDKVIEWIANNLPKETYVNIMSQYVPAYKAKDFHEINRRITIKEYRDIIKAAQNAGLTNIRGQGD